MVPDFYGVLEENQIHIGFSTAFIDKRLQWSDTMLHEIDVLVARLPAALPSDIHKVRAVFRPELAHLKDVVVFPTKGRFCLADKLSGGDYDGDRAWVCWNEAIVKAFKNFDAPKKQDPAHYGIQKDGTRIQDILNLDADTRATQFIKAGFEFNMRKSLLGRCTNMHEDFCYKLVVDAARNGWNMGDFFSPMSDRRAMDFANLLGYLVDTAKNGYTFTEHNYDVYLKSIAANNLPDPAYKRKNGAKATNHVIDQIVLVEALNFRQKALRKLDQITGISSVTTRPPRDGDLTRLFKDEKDTAKDDPVVSFILSNLKKDIDYLVSKWDILVSQRRNGQISWSEVHNSIREHFTNIIPAKKSENGLDLLNHSLVQRWHLSTNEESPTLSTHNSWSLLKASACYTRTSIGPLPWRACGKELMALKVLANQNGVSISNEMHQYFKLDRRMWETAKLIRSEREEMILGGELTRFDEDEFMSQVPEEVYEWQANAE